MIRNISNPDGERGSLAENDPEDGEVAADGAADHEAEDDGPGDVGRPRHVVQRLVAAAALVKLPVCSGRSSLGPPQGGRLTLHQTFLLCPLQHAQNAK